MHDESRGSLGGARPPGILRRPSDWLVIACVGAILLGIGIYRPATSWIALPQFYGTNVVAYAFAVVGGVVWMWGFASWYDARPGSPAQRRRPPTRVDMARVKNLSSFEVYRAPPQKGRRGGPGDGNTGP